MKKVFNCDYPNENADAIKEWLESVLLKPEDGSLSDIGFRPTIIVEIIPNK